MSYTEPFLDGWYQPDNDHHYFADYGGITLEVYQSNIGDHWFAEITFWDEESIVRQHDNAETAMNWCELQCERNYKDWENAYINSDD